MLALSVECYAGYRGEETPARFQLGDRLIEIDEVLDRWLAPDHRYFKVRTVEGIYILRNDMTAEWELVSFSALIRMQTPFTRAWRTRLEHLVGCSVLQC